MKFHPLISLLFCLAVLTACGSREEKASSVHGAWLGEGVFTSPHGTMAMRAQLELLSDGSYRMLVLDPPVLMIFGMEKGSWSHQDGSLHLNPIEEEVPENLDTESTSPIRLLQSAPRNFQPKTLTTNRGLSRLSLDDGPMKLEFQRNREATRVLREKGEI